VEIYKNKKSGKYFIYIQDVSLHEALFVNPKCRIIAFPYKHFYDSPKEGEAGAFVSENLITTEQVKRFEEYKQDRARENYNNKLNHIRNLSHDKWQITFDEFRLTEEYKRTLKQDKEVTHRTVKHLQDEGKP